MRSRGTGVRESLLKHSNDYGITGHAPKNYDFGRPARLSLVTIPFGVVTMRISIWCALVVADDGKTVTLP